LPTSPKEENAPNIESRRHIGAKRLEGRKYKAILLRNGYGKSVPEMMVEFRGLRRIGRGRNAEYAIRLGRILELKRWPLRSP
jgi:hypothetical protein